MTQTTITTGNPIVDSISKLNITGNITPETWYKTISNEKGKPNLLAITILSDIVYWYRPTEQRDESGLAISYAKKFADKDYLQRNYEQISSKFCVSKTQARDAVVFLENLGVIKRHLRTVSTANGPLPNVMFLELIPDRVIELTYPESSNADTLLKADRSPEISRDTSTKIMTSPNKKADTYTKATTENISKTSTTSLEDTFVADEIKEIFRQLHLSDKDIETIFHSSGNDPDKCKQAIVILNQQTRPISNVVGWLIKAVKENYQPVAKTPTAKKNTFNNFHQREYNYDELEKRLLNSSL